MKGPSSSTMMKDKMSSIPGHDSCRSLVCDPTGIIISEMVYRCMICNAINDSVDDSRSHYHEKHIDTEGEDAMPPLSIDDPLIFPDENLDIEESEEDRDDTTSSVSQTCSSNKGPSSSTCDLAIGYKDLDLGSTSSPSAKTPPSKRRKGSDRSSRNNDSSHSIGPVDLALTNYSTNGNGNGVPIQTSGTNGSCTIKSGYITCPVCNCTKFYTTLQRRYGQFSCVGCYRFFKEFFVHPKTYGCVHLGRCPLDLRTKCKACWIKKCTDVYTVDEGRHVTLSNHRPLKKEMGDSGSLSPSDTKVLKLTHNNNNNNNNNNQGEEEEEEDGETVLPLNLSDSPMDLKAAVAAITNRSINSLVMMATSTPPQEETVVEEEAAPSIPAALTSSDSALDGSVGEGDTFPDEEEEEDMEQDREEPDEMMDREEEGTNSLDDADEIPMDEGMGPDSVLGSSSSIDLPSVYERVGGGGGAGGASDAESTTSKASLPRRKTSSRIKNWCCLKCANCLADDCGKCINCLDRPKFGGPFIRKQRCLYKKCLMKTKPLNHNMTF